MSGSISAGISYSEPTSVQYEPISGQEQVTQSTTPVSVSLIGNQKKRSLRLLRSAQLSP